MTTPERIVFGGSEILAVVAVARIWLKRRHKKIPARLIWSLILLVPIFGLLTYFFLRESPDEHPDNTDTMRGSGIEGIGDDFGNHSNDSH